MPAGQGLGAAVPGGQKCPEREADDPTGQGQGKATAWCSEQLHPKPSSWRVQGALGPIGEAALEPALSLPPQSLPQPSPGGYLQGKGHRSGLPVSRWGRGPHRGRRSPRCRARKGWRGRKRRSSSQAGMGSRRPAGDAPVRSCDGLGPRRQRGLARPNRPSSHPDFSLPLSRA